MTYPMDSYRNHVPMLAFPIKLDCGAGEYPKDEFVRLDFDPCNGGTDIIWDVAEHGIPLPDNSVCELHSSHFLEHLRPVHYHYVLSEFFRVCENGASVTLTVPHGSSPQGALPCHYNRFVEDDMRAIAIWLPPENGPHWDLKEVVRDGYHLTGRFVIVKP